MYLLGKFFGVALFRIDKQVAIMRCRMFPSDEENDEEFLPLGKDDSEANGRREVASQAKYHMERFFADKKLATGGSVTKTFLFHPSRLSMVLGYSICDGVDKVYGALKSEVAGEKANSNSLPSDVRMVTETLNLIARSGVPQQYAGGMLCVYVELVEGVRLEP